MCKKTIFDEKNYCPTCAEDVSKAAFYRLIYVLRGWFKCAKCGRRFKVEWNGQ